MANLLLLAVMVCLYTITSSTAESTVLSSNPSSMLYDDDIAALVHEHLVPLLPPRVPTEPPSPIAIATYNCSEGKLVENLRSFGHISYGIDDTNEHVVSGEWPEASRHFYFILDMSIISRNNGVQMLTNPVEGSDAALLVIPRADIVISLSSMWFMPVPSQGRHPGYIRMLTARHPDIILFSEPIDAKSSEAHRILYGASDKKQAFPLSYWQTLFCEYSYQIDLEETVKIRHQWLEMARGRKADATYGTMLNYRILSSLFVFRPFVVDDILMRPVSSLVYEDVLTLLRSREEEKLLCQQSSNTLADRVCGGSAWQQLLHAMTQQLDAEKQLLRSYSDKSTVYTDVCYNLINATLPTPVTIDTFGIRPDYIPNAEDTHYDDVTDGGLRFQNEVYLYAKRFMHENNLQKVVDVGCGNGYKLVNVLGEFDTVGIDTDPAYSYLTKTYPSRKWLKSGDQEKSFVAYNLSADLVIASNVIEHIRNPDDLLDFIDSINAPYILISTPERTALQAYPYFGSIFGPSFHKHHIREWTYAEFRRYISRRYDVRYHAVSNAENYCQYALVTKRNPATPRAGFTPPVPSFNAITPGVSEIGFFKHYLSDHTVRLIHGGDLTAYARDIGHYVVCANQKLDPQYSLPEIHAAEFQQTVRNFTSALARNMRWDPRVWMVRGMVRAPIVNVEVVAKFGAGLEEATCLGLLHWPVSVVTDAQGAYSRDQLVAQFETFISLNFIRVLLGKTYDGYIDAAVAAIDAKLRTRRS